jgi:hypothetical protein
MQGQQVFFNVRFDIGTLTKFVIYKEVRQEVEQHEAGDDADIEDRRDIEIDMDAIHVARSGEINKNQIKNGGQINRTS